MHEAKLADTELCDIWYISINTSVFEKHLQPGTAVWGSQGQPGFPRRRRCWAAESAVLSAAAGAAVLYLSVCLQTSPPKVRNSPGAAKKSDTSEQCSNSEGFIVYQLMQVQNHRSEFLKKGGIIYASRHFIVTPVAFISTLTQRTSAMHS